MSVYVSDGEWKLTNPKPPTLYIGPEVVKPLQFLAKKALMYGISRNAAAILPFIRAAAYSSSFRIRTIFSSWIYKTFLKYATTKESTSHPTFALLFFNVSMVTGLSFSCWRVIKDDKLAVKLWVVIKATKSQATITIRDKLLCNPSPEKKIYMFNQIMFLIYASELKRHGYLWVKKV